MGTFVWKVRDPLGKGPAHPDEARRLAARLGLHPVMGQILLARGLRQAGDALEFLRRGGRPPDPWRLSGVPEAAWRIWRAVRRGETIVVYGDYDADGQTSTAILVRALRRLGARVQSFIPHRLSLGYGLHAEVLLEMAREGVGLVVAVDCGLTAAAAVRRARQEGLDVVVVDHHEPPSRLPPAAAIVAAHRLKGWPGVSQMSAAGLAYHTARAVLELGGAEEPQGELVQLAAIGTVADVVSLTGENRRLVAEGLQALRRGPLPGLAALGQVAGLDLQGVEAHHVAFVLAPRLNAAGRVDDASAGLQLLLASHPEEARLLAERLEQANRLRQRAEQAVLEAAAEQVALRLARSDSPVAVAVGELWHPGVIGIVASRLAERFGRPAVVISLDEEEARGSARSVPGVDIYRLLEQCAHLLARFGGHPMAAGFSLERRQVEAFVAALEEAAARQLPEIPPPALELDGWVGLDQVDGLLVRQLGLLEPYGEGNPRPVLATGGLELVEARAVGAEGRHLRLVVRDPASGLERVAVAFGRAESWGRELEQQGRRARLDLAFSPRFGRFGEVELHLAGLRPAEPQPLPVILSGPAWPPAPAPARVGGRAAAVACQDGAAPTGRRAGGPAPLAVQDRRGLSEEGTAALGGWLREELNRHPMPGGPVLVGVRSFQRALSVAFELWEHGLAEAFPVAWGDRHTLRGAGAGQLFDRAVLLVTWDPEVLAAQESAPAPTVVLWDLPDDGPRWAQASARAGAARVVLAYGPSSVQALRRDRLGALPDLEALRAVYRLITAHAALSGARLGETAQLARALAVLDEGGPPLPREGLETALCIFEEVGLASRLPDGGWLWRGAPAGLKLDLTRSRRYNEVVGERAYWVDYLRRAWELDSGDLWRHWLNGGGPGEPSESDAGFESPHPGDPGLSAARG